MDNECGGYLVPTDFLAELAFYAYPFMSPEFCKYAMPFYRELKAVARSYEGAWLLGDM
jgi:hypothetical protein